jgi:hypothetical protein
MDVWTSALVLHAPTVARVAEHKPSLLAKLCHSSRMSRQQDRSAASDQVETWALPQLSPTTVV